MRKATENQGNTRSPREYYSPKSKGNEHTIQQGFQPNFTSSYQETPMKPSQVPNRLLQPPPRRALPLQSPELCHRDRLCPPWQPSHNLGPFQSPGFVPSSPTSIGRPYHVPRDRMVSPQHSDQLQFVQVNTTKLDTLGNRPKYSPPSMFYHTTPQFMRDLSHHSSSSHIRRDQATESKVSVSHPGNKTLTTQSQESNKVQSGESRSFVPSIQLRRPPVTSSLNSTAAQQHFSQPSDPEQLKLSTSRSYGLPPSTHSSDASSGSSLLIKNSPVAPGQEHQHMSTTSNNTQIPVVDLNCSTQKRRRDSKDSDNNAKKLCFQGAQTPKLSDRTSLSPSQVMSSGLAPPMGRTSKTTDANLCTEPLDQSACVKHSSTPKSCPKRLPPMGAKQAFINSCQNHIVRLGSSPNSGVVSLKKNVEENDNRVKSSNLLFHNIPQKNTINSPDVLLGSRQSGHIPCNTSLIPVKNLCKNKQVGEGQESNSCTPRPASHPSLGSSSRSALKQKKPSHQRKRPSVPNDVHELFTPDPMTYVVSSTHKLAKPKGDCETVKSPILDKCSSGTATISTLTDTGSSCHKTQSSPLTRPLRAGEKKDFLTALNPQVFLPTVALVRVKPNLQNDEHCRPKDRHLKNSPISSLGKLFKERGVKSNENITSPLPDTVSSHISDTDISASKQILTSPCSQSPMLRRQSSEKSTKQVNEEDPIDVELGLSFALDVDLTQSSNSSEEEQLLSLQEMMERVTKPPETPEKGAFSEPSTPGHRSSHLKSQPLPSTTNSGIYKNSLDQMLKEINTNKKAKEIETQLISACKEDLLRIAEFEEAEENQEEGISTEQQEFLQRYSLMSNAIREVPPGEVAFDLGKFGQIFNQETLQLRQCMVTPQGAAQKTLLWSSPAQLRLHVTIGLFQEAYEYSFCPTQVTRFLFKMMSVHSERLVSEMMLQALCDIACTAAFQRVKNGNQQFKVWVPSLADVTLVLMNMGVAFVTLFPFEYLQPSFTEGDLLEEEHVKIESLSNNNELSTFPEHNCNSILKYLSYCMGLCPRAYSDDELLLLLTVVGRIGLDPRLILKASVELYPLQYKIVNNIRNWDTMLPRICQAYTDLTDDHHNMCLLVQMQPDSTRGKQLRRHLSLSMISKLLDGNCTYRPTENEFQLSELRPYLPRMQPSTILRAMLSSSSKSQKDTDMTTLDQQAYYLCYSLLTLANEASNFQFFPAQQKQQLLNLCSELETHVKCDIRESEKCLYRSKVKDLVARIYTKWQMLLQRTRPLDGKLYDYWQPVVTDTLTSSLEESTTDSSDDGEGNEVREDSDSEMEEDEQEKETSGSDQNEVVIIDGKQKEDERQGREENVICDEDLKMVDENPVHDLNETEDAVGEGSGEHNMPEMEPGVQQESKAIEEKTDAESTSPTEVEAETVDTSFAPSNENQVPACDAES